MTKQLPEDISRESKRLLKIANETNGIVNIPNLSTAQDLISRIKGKHNTHATLLPITEPNLNDVALALAVGQAMGDENIRYQEDSGGEVAIYIRSDDYKTFSHSVIGCAPHWDPSHDTHALEKYEIAICIQDDDDAGLVPERLFNLAKYLFLQIGILNETFGFAYYQENLQGPYQGKVSASSKFKPGQNDFDNFVLDIERAGITIQAKDKFLSGGRSSTDWPAYVTSMAITGRRDGVRFFRKRQDSPDIFTLVELLGDYPFTADQKGMFTANIVIE